MKYILIGILALVSLCSINAQQLGQSQVELIPPKVLSHIFWDSSPLRMKEVNWRATVINVSIGIIQGYIDGTFQALNRDADGVCKKNAFIRQNRQWFDPNISWKNKYKNHNPAQGEAYFQSEGLLVAFTDMYHFNRPVQLLGQSAQVVVSINLNGNYNWKEMILHIAAGFVARSITTELVINHYMK